MRDELVVILPGLFNPQTHNNELLRPVARLEEVEELEAESELAVGVLEPHVFGPVPYMSGSFRSSEVWKVAYTRSGGTS